MFSAALISLSWIAPHSQHTHSLIERPFTPFGALAGIARQREQVLVVLASSTSTYQRPRALALYLIIVLNIVVAASLMDLVLVVLASFFCTKFTDNNQIIFISYLGCSLLNIVHSLVFDLGMDRSSLSFSLHF